jgi:hypothetical protein
MLNLIYIKSKTNRGIMKTQYAICLVFTKDKEKLIRIETIMYYGEIDHPREINPKDVFDKEKAVKDSMSKEQSTKLITDGFEFFLANHCVLSEKEKSPHNKE